MRQAGPLARECFVKHVLMILWLCSLCAGALAQSYPSRPVRIINPYVPGGSTDIVLRTLAAKLTDAWGHGVVIENKPGGGTNIGTELAAKSPADGYTLLNATSSLAINISMYSKLPFDAQKDLTPVVMLTQSPNLLAVHPSVPATSLKELIELARARPGSLSYGSSGNGATNHLAMELLKSMAGVNFIHIPYKGGGQALNDLLGGQIQLMFNPPASLMQHAAKGRVRLLAISTAKRVEGIDLPTLSEAGLPGFESTVWFGLFAPAGTPVPVIRRIAESVNAILHQPEVVEQFRAAGLVIAGGTPEELQQTFRTDIARWAKVVKSSGARVD